MKVTYEYAVVHYCPDLTDPDARSTPVALIGLSHPGSDPGFLFVGVGENPFTSAPDPLGLYADLPEFFGKLLKRGLDEAKPDAILAWVRARLGGTLSMGKVERRESTLRSLDAEAVTGELFRLLHAEVRPAPKRSATSRKKRTRRSPAFQMSDVRISRLHAA